MTLSSTARGTASAERGRHRVIYEGRTMKGDTLWTAEEIEAVKAFYPDTARLCIEIPLRTPKAIRSKAWKLGLCRTYHPWTGSEITRLRRLFPTAGQAELLASFPGKTKAAIFRRAYQRGLRREASPPPSGQVGLDQIRRRCAELKITLADLARDLGVRDFYFQLPARDSDRAVAALAKAANYLGGHLEVVWDDVDKGN